MALLVEGWHAIGGTSYQGVPITPKPSFTTVKASSAWSTYQQGLGHLGRLTNSILEVVAPNAFKAYQELSSHMGRTSGDYKKKLAIDPCLHQGRSVAWNRCTAMHKDTRGPVGEYTIMVCIQGPPGKYS